MVSAEPRMELLPEEWQALADVEVAARAVDGLFEPTRTEFPAYGGVHTTSWGAEKLDALRVSLRALEQVRGRVAPVDGDRTREDERVQEASFRDDTPRNHGIRPMADG